MSADLVGTDILYVDRSYSLQPTTDLVEKLTILNFSFLHRRNSCAYHTSTCMNQGVQGRCNLLSANISFVAANAAPNHLFTLLIVTWR